MCPNHNVINVKNKSIQGVLTFESPVSVSGVIKGRCTMGFLSYIGSRAEVYNDTEIGRFCSIAADVIIAPTNHPTDRLSSHLFAFSNYGPFKNNKMFSDWVRGPKAKENALKTKIGNDVWIGRGAIIKRGVNVGDGAVIGAGAVVVKDVEPFSIVGGVPAKTIKKRFNNDIELRLRNIQWWNYQLDKISVPNLNLNDIEQSISFIEQGVKDGFLKPIDVDKYMLDNKGDLKKIN